jgi:hypothetical protein
MVFVVLLSVSAGSAVFTVLDRPFACDGERHTRRCRALLTVSATLLVITAALAVGGRLAAGAP